MNGNRITLIAGIVCLLFAISALNAQVKVPLQPLNSNVIYLYQEGLPQEVDIETYSRTGEVVLLQGKDILPPKITPGPAPGYYPHVHMWEKGIEQLGDSPDDCDGIWFINANLWHPKKWALVRWKIRIPNADQRSATEFEQDVNLHLWVDFNNDRAWGKNEKMLEEHLNLQEYFPTSSSFIEISYLTMFRIPATAELAYTAGTVDKIEGRVWARGIISYDDPDTSPDGECLFGEVEDYHINWFEIMEPEKKKE